MLNDVYNRRILELAGQFPRLGRLDPPDAPATAHSKLCGSTVTVDLKMDGDAVADFAHEVKACALGQASSSIMARNVVGANGRRIAGLRDDVRRMLKENGAPPAGQMGRYRGARAGARLQGAACLDTSDLRCGGRRDQPDRGEAARCCIRIVIKIRSLLLGRRAAGPHRRFRGLLLLGRQPVLHRLQH